MALDSPELAVARRGAAVLAIASLGFSAMALFAKAASSYLPGPELACLRFLVGFCAIIVPLATGRGLHPVNYGSLLLRGMFGGGAVGLYFLAISHLPVGLATLLNSVWPLFGAIFSFIFLGEPLRLRMLLALALTGAGVTMVVFGNAPTGGALHLGDHGVFWTLVGLSSAVCSGAAVTTIRSMRQSEGSWEIFLAFCLIGAILTGIPTALSWVPIQRGVILFIIGMGLSSVLAQMGMTYALRDVRAITAGLILQLTPVTTLLLGALLFHEWPTPLGWVGTLLALAGITWGMILR